MDIRLLKFFISILALKFWILASSRRVFCHGVNHLCFKFLPFVPYCVTNTLKIKNDRSFKESNLPSWEDSYRKGTNCALKGLAFVCGQSTFLNPPPSRTYGHEFTGANDWCKIGYKERPIGNYRYRPFSDPPSDRYNATTLLMSRKVTYGYRYNPERAKRKGTTRSRIFFELWKDRNPYYLIHRFLLENDPDNPAFRYDPDLARRLRCRRNIFAHFKRDCRLRFFWYASRKKAPRGPCSRHINYALDRNEFRFSRLHSFFHLLPYVHSHYRDDPRYVYFMNRFLSRHGRVAAFKREHGLVGGSAGTGSEASSSSTDAIGGTATTDTNAQVPSTTNTSPPTTPETDTNPDKPPRYRRSISWKEMRRLARREEEELFSRVATPPVRVDLGNGRSFTVKRDGFTVFGEYYSRIAKANRRTPYDVYSPFLRTKHSSRRRRFRAKIPLDPALRCKTRRERLLRNAKNRDVSQFVKRYLKQKPKST